ncbi:DUF5615 family PIN-like protein [Marinobacter orientalis]|uniref:DUF5615 family PIN-like protein n=1 Tax=Marinobacter orientalis TaxID=1928859 RepID=A0A7Y0NJM2_9GAMM|nr:DUF5615 family PIN-like protein [Marinobacter orientalis]NMT62696.1 DUF5615 family PIN-like protein [Marinobacter orientalis]TGX51381.1 hypothetical protein DIT72_04970 [Marinobacter orientalis]
MKLIEGSLCSLAPLRFVCDEMLNGLAQWLRIAGYDVTMPVEGASDRQLVEQAQAQQRWIITADSDLLEFSCAPFYVIYLAAQGECERLQELTLRLDLDWCYAPFSRCKNCNTPLHPASDREIQNFYPQASKLDGQNVLACATCRQLYWEGSHVRRMRHRLEAMNSWRDALSPPH